MKINVNWDKVKLSMLLLFFLWAGIFIYLQVGWLLFGVMAGFGVVFAPLCLTQPPTYYFSRYLRPEKVTRWVIVRRTLLGLFFLWAGIFMYLQVGWLAFGVMAGFGLVFAPLFLTKPAMTNPHADVFLDPVNSGLRSNIHHKNDE